MKITAETKAERNAMMDIVSLCFELDNDDNICVGSSCKLNKNPQQQVDEMNKCLDVMYRALCKKS